VAAGGVRAGSIGYVPQLDGSERSFPLTAAGAVELGLAASSSPLPWFSRSERAAARAALDRLGVGELHARRLDELSGGQFQRVLLARALVARPRLLLLDEPTSGVDLRTRADVLRLLDELRADGLAIVLTTHDLNWVAAHLPRLVCLNGTILADGPPAAVLRPSVLGEAFGAEVVVVDHDGRLLVTDATPPLARP
jgi:ABC-type Mn2+/Zn2+ transport system ATPase subunit